MNITARLEALRAREHTATVEIIEALVELKRSQEYLALGYSSIWDFLVQRLHYSNAAASRRYKAMKCAERCPQVLTMLREHRTSLSALAQVQSTLERVENPDRLLAEIAGQPAREVERALARRHPVRRPKERVRRKYVGSKSSPSRKKSARVAGGDGLFDGSSADTTSPSNTTSASEQALERVLISFSLSPEDFEDLEEVRSILSRKLPDGVSVEDAFRELMAFFLKHKRPKPSKKASKGVKRAKTNAGRTAPNRRYVPKPVRDRVWRRDRGRCTYVGRDGHHCGSRHDLQVDHIQPVAVGGSSDETNLRLLCASHNRYRTRDLLPTRKSGSVGASGRGRALGDRPRPQ